MNNNIITKDKRAKEELAKYMFEELEKAASIKENQLRIYDKMMRSNSEIDVSKCKGRD